MKICKIQNGINLVYEHREGKITSFCIGFNAGALMEEENEMGIAHVVEHMLFKGTSKRDELKINRLCDEIFGFNNAMTNFPYAIYYGTTLSEDFSKGFDLYSEIVKEPAFPEEGFKEEIDVICEELKEWKDDNFQLCEDELLNNAFRNRRIKTCIIGNEDGIKNFSLKDVRDFYNRYYNPDNCVISVVSSLRYEEVLNVVEKYMTQWKGQKTHSKDIIYEKNSKGIFIKNKAGIEGAKIQYCFTIDKLTEGEMAALNTFNYKFGSGTSGILYDDIRTKNGLAYDVFSSIKNENGIKLFTISMGTSITNVDKAIEIINRHISNIDNFSYLFSKNNIEPMLNSIKLKRELQLEKSIELSKVLAVNKIMYDNFDLFSLIDYSHENIEEREIMCTAKKILKDPTIQILTS
ncbi:M16 family metallopeptidase [Clostridium pasteurianum]|uniref:Putative Zn-dependent peptidase n=1 Tax=Clostridium pasteurianum BC1 TaxID=86416 RepID=R4K3W1_CLOPA|nr:pitrilysin family protein [Clostridium pasteurianum]AGK97822.1 putative Zn-dependent peptidase [Clostridium pasteurianum BC1]